MHSPERIEMDHRSLNDDDIERLTDYMTAGAYVLKTKNGFRIPALVVEQWRENGFAVLRTNALAARYGVGRKTMWNTIKGAIDAGFIKEIGRTEDGRAMYVPVVERGDEWRAAHDARMAKYEQA